MAADLLALEHEIREGRLSLDCFSNGRLVVAKFAEGVLEFDYNSYNGSMPEGYIIRYGSDRKGRLEYFVNIEELINAELSEKWIEVAPHTRAKAGSGGIKVRRTEDFVRGFSTKAELSCSEWNIARQYAFKAVRANRLRELPLELERYTIEALDSLAGHLGVMIRKLPSVELNPNKKGPSCYNIPQNRIIFTTVKQSLIYEEAGHCLHSGHMPKIPDESYPLDILFRKSLEETIGYYCAKFGDRSRTPGDSMLSMYGVMESEAEAVETKMADYILSLEIEPEEAEMLSCGAICRQPLVEANNYVRKYKHLARLSHHIGAKLGERIFEAGGRDIIQKMILSEDTRHSLAFFSILRELRIKDEIKRDIRSALKKERR